MDTSVIGQIAALKRMSVAELSGEWLRLYGEPARSRNRDYLFRRLAWRIQELRVQLVGAVRPARCHPYETPGPAADDDLPVIVKPNRPSPGWYRQPRPEKRLARG